MSTCQTTPGTGAPAATLTRGRISAVRLREDRHAFRGKPDRWPLPALRPPSIGEGGMGTVWAAINEAFGREVARSRSCSARSPPTPPRSSVSITEAHLRHHPSPWHRGRPRRPARSRTARPFSSWSCSTARPSTASSIAAARFVRSTSSRSSGTWRAPSRSPHERDVIHRDIKPGNIFLHRLPNGQMVAKVLDFGISKVNRKSSPSPTMTQTGTVVGSPAYMSPEQAAGRVELDARSDVYGLGVILYEVLSGRLLSRPRTTTPSSSTSPSASRRLSAASSRASRGPCSSWSKATMMHDRDQRIPSALALADRIDATLTALGASPTLAPRSAPRSAAAPRPDREPDVAAIRRLPARRPAHASHLALPPSPASRRRSLGRRRRRPGAPASPGHRQRRIARSRPPSPPAATATASTASAAPSADREHRARRHRERRAGRHGGSRWGPFEAPVDSRRCAARAQRVAVPASCGARRVGWQGNEGALRRPGEEGCPGLLTDGRRTRLALALFAAMALWRLFARRAGTPEDEKKSRQYFAEADSLANLGRWKDACVLFQAAHDLNATNGTAYRTAECHERTGEDERALAPLSIRARPPLHRSGARARDAGGKAPSRT